MYERRNWISKGSDDATGELTEISLLDLFSCGEAHTHIHTQILKMMMKKILLIYK